MRGNANANKLISHNEQIYKDINKLIHQCNIIPQTGETDTFKTNTKCRKSTVYVARPSDLPKYIVKQSIVDINENELNKLANELDLRIFEPLPPSDNPKGETISNDENDIRINSIQIIDTNSNENLIVTFYTFIYDIFDLLLIKLNNLYDIDYIIYYMYYLLLSLLVFIITLILVNDILLFNRIINV